MKYAKVTTAMIQELELGMDGLSTLYSLTNDLQCLKSGILSTPDIEVFLSEFTLNGESYPDKLTVIFITPTSRGEFPIPIMLVTPSLIWHLIGKAIERAELVPYSANPQLN